MTIYRHPDGSYHRYPHRESAPAQVPVAGRPNRFSDGKGGEPFYVEPVKPPQGEAT